ncbi:MAG: hypothetical protein L3V56_03420 [Candidatus Magnetoovum sp. WYHC-5]|nr:hypothetical protein [Candidatus Magnetoovum sp. WYHC-5]
MITKVFYVISSLVIGVVLLLFGLWYIAIPEKFIEAQLKSLLPLPYRMEFARLNKGVFFYMDFEIISLYKDKEKLLVIERLKASVKPSELIFGNVKVYLNGDLAGGNVFSTIVPKDNIYLAFNQINLNQIGYLKKVGINGEGVLNGVFEYSKNTGNLKFTIEPFMYEDYFKGSTYLPLKYFKGVRGALSVVGFKGINITSLTAYGEGIFVRVKGEADFNHVDLTVELTSEANFPDKDKLLLLKNYETSPGHYLIKFKKQLHL